MCVIPPPNRKTGYGRETERLPTETQEGGEAGWRTIKESDSMERQKVNIHCQDVDYYQCCHLMLI